jgi:hypothetical protein
MLGMCMSVKMSWKGAPKSRAACKTWRARFLVLANNEKKITGLGIVLLEKMTDLQGMRGEIVRGEKPR